MPLSSVVCVGLSPHVDTCQTSHHDSAKKNNSHSLKQTQNTFMCLASLVQCMYFRRFTKSQSHLQQIPPISFILPQLCAHDAFKITKQLVTEFVLSLTVASDHPSTPPPVVPTGRFWGPRPSLSTASTAAPTARSRSTTAASPSIAAQCSAVRPQAPKGSETSTAGGLHPVALHRPPPLQWEKLQSVEWSPWVSSFSKLYNELAQWQPLLVFVKIAKTTNWWNLPKQKIRKGKTVLCLTS